jgi:alpha-tubulin suppressor-like RCC1 family protein
VLCWGRNNHGQLGNTDVAASAYPSLAGNGSIHFGHIAAGGDVTCGITAGMIENGLVYCWGDGTLGQMGDGNNNGTNGMTEVAEPLQTARAVSISVGGDHVCVIADDEKIYCWGSNSGGQLGDGTTNDSNVPVEAGGTGTMSVIAAGNGHTCGINNDDSNHYVFCWGEGEQGQVGDGTNTDSPNPSQVDYGFGFSALSAGDRFTCGISLDDNHVYCWGLNDAGQISDYSTSNAASPTLSNFFTTASKVSIGSGGHACLMRASDNSVWCWGNNLAGQLGVGWSGVNYIGTAYDTYAEQVIH